MLLVRLVLVLLLITVLIGQTKPIVKSGMLMEVVLGLLVILVQLLMETNQLARVKDDVATIQQVVVVSEMKAPVIRIVVALGAIILNRVLVLMRQLVEQHLGVLPAMTIVQIILMQVEMVQPVQL